MTVTEAQLRARFPNVFPTAFPSAVLLSAIAETYYELSAAVWGDLLDTGAMWRAGELALMETIRTALLVGTTGSVASMTTLVGSISYDTGGTGGSLDDQLSIFRSQFLYYARMVTPPLDVSGS